MIEYIIGVTVAMLIFVTLFHASHMWEEPYDNDD